MGDGRMLGCLAAWLLGCLLASTAVEGEVLLLFCLQLLRRNNTGYRVFQS